MCWPLSPNCAIDWAAAGNWATVLVTLVALWIARRQLQYNAKAAGQAHARQAWMSYLRLGVEYPQFGSTADAMRMLGVASVDELYTRGSLETERYWWFLDIMLEAMEALVEYFPEKEWQNTIEFNLKLHRDGIQYRWPETHIFFSDQLCRITKRVLDSPRHLPVESASAQRTGPIV